MEKQRLLSLDVFRGITVAAMILVNNPGSWDHVYSPLRHAHWNGCTPTDLIFPFFLFIVGMSIHFAYESQKVNGLSQKVFMKIVRRTLIIFGLGIFLTWFPVFTLQRIHTFRIPGVLQRISIVFFFTSLLYFKTNWLLQARIVMVLLIGYFVVMTNVPVPDFGPANLEPETNLGAWFDRLILNGHLWVQSKTWDPEGIFSTLPAIATGMLGALAGQLFSKLSKPAERVSWLFFIGAIFIVSGLAWDLVFPINKALWTSSFVLYTAGIALQFFAACYWLIDVQGIRKWATPFIYYGMNAIFVFVAAAMAAKLMARIRLMDEGEETSLWSYWYKYGFESWLPASLASLLMASSLLLLFLLVLWQMYKRKVFIKV